MASKGYKTLVGGDTVDKSAAVTMQGYAILR